MSLSRIRMPLLCIVIRGIRYHVSALQWRMELVIKTGEAAHIFRRLRILFLEGFVCFAQKLAIISLIVDEGDHVFARNSPYLFDAFQEKHLQDELIWCNATHFVGEFWHGQDLLKDRNGDYDSQSADLRLLYHCL